MSACLYVCVCLNVRLYVGLSVRFPPVRLSLYYVFFRRLTRKTTVCAFPIYIYNIRSPHVELDAGTENNSERGMALRRVA